jgi:hypothetical protein
VHFLTWNAYVLPSALDGFYKSLEINCSIKRSLITHDNGVDKTSYLFKTYSNPRWNKRKSTMEVARV